MVLSVTTKGVPGQNQLPGEVGGGGGEGPIISYDKKLTTVSYGGRNSIAVSYNQKRIWASYSDRRTRVSYGEKRTQSRRKALASII